MIVYIRVRPFKWRPTELFQLLFIQRYYFQTTQGETGIQDYSEDIAVTSLNEWYCKLEVDLSLAQELNRKQLRESLQTNPEEESRRLKN